MKEKAKRRGWTVKAVESLEAYDPKTGIELLDEYGLFTVDENGITLEWMAVPSVEAAREAHAEAEAEAGG